MYCFKYAKVSLAAAVLAAPAVAQDAANPPLPLPLSLPLLAEAAPAAATAVNPPGPAAANAPALDVPPAISLLPDPGAAPAPMPAASLSENVTVNLINRLVQRGALTQADATDLIRLAELDAQMARGQAQALAETQAAVRQQAAATPAPASEDEYRVTYIPEVVKDQIREELRTEVLGQARKEKWITPSVGNEWTSRIKIFGDIRMRYDSISYPAGNDTTGAFPNFNAINTGAPYDTAGGVFAPQLNSSEERERFRLRTRVGFDIDLDDGFTAGIRMATGGNNAPVSTNQTLGSASSGSAGQGGNFSKYELWLDRAFIKYEASLLPQANLLVLLGRFDNPFMTSSQIMWDEDVGLDGLAFKITSPWTKDFKTFVTAGGFPVFNSDLNFPSNSPDKYSSYNKYLLAAQFGVEFKINDDIEAKMSLAYYDWKNIEGRLSSPFVPLNPTDAGDTDNSRPLFAQKGNTYRPIRNIASSPLNGNGTLLRYQYYGLASEFRQIAWSGRIDFNHYEPMQISVLGEYVKNLAFDSAAINSYAINNRTGGGAGTFDGGDTAWYMGVNVGKAVPTFEKRGDWALGMGYRHVESDAVVDGLNDSVFGGGGTNMEGYTINAALALSKRTWMRLSYMSATQIAGPAFKSDVFLFDISAKF